ncbi:hypothetical protein IV417_06910 [Alphaproteobacteria bacterium KMM 3653]|uniref:Lipoprotein n=1 Tax=Harenicola maris TaxID=2841044 RepID=A0AAP2CMI0_9RHOB|nr:hypothetical protein [Harenicola maris]
MKQIKLIALALATASVAACTTSVPTETATRGAPLEAATQQTASITGDYYAVQKVNVIVPSKLIVSEADALYPKADIVWREDPRGNRHDQVQKIVQDALTAGAARLTSGTPVVVDVEVTRFHALTEKARYHSATGFQWHDIDFRLTVRDAQTGEVLESRKVEAPLRAYAGTRALAAEMQGITQKSRISQHLSSVIVKELGPKA